MPTFFYDREWEQQWFWRQLADGKHILLCAPRRVGKTMLLHRLRERAEMEGWLTIFIDVQAASDEVDFLHEIADSLERASLSPNWKSKIGNLFSGLRKLLPTRVKHGESELQFSERINDAFLEVEKRLKQLFIALGKKDAKPVLIGMDELPIFLGKLTTNSGIDRAAAILHRMRRWQHDPDLGHVRWFLCGSVGLDTFVEHHGLAGTINALRLEKLGPFTADIARDFLLELALRRSVPLSTETAVYMVEKIGWPLPFYLEVLFDQLQAQPPSQNPAFPTVEDVDAAYDSLLHQTAYFAHWDSRLDWLGPVKGATVRFILKQMCLVKRGMNFTKLTDLLALRSPQAETEGLHAECGSLLGILEKEGYLQSSGQTWAFRSPLLRDYWKRTHP